MAIAITAAGITVKYAPETVKGTRPTTGYTAIPDIKSIPEFGTDINALQSTDLSQTLNHTYTPGLRDSGGSWGLTANDSDEFHTAWDTAVAAYATAKGNDLGFWFEIAIPTMDSFFIPGQPVALGFGGAEVDSVLETTANILPEGDYVWATASN